MPEIPLQLTFQNLTIHTSGIFLFLAIISAFFIVWREGRKDGFDTEKLFDMLLVSVFFGIVFSRIFYAFNHALSSQEFFGHIYKFWIPGFNILGGMIGFLIPVFLFSKIWSWSIYRLLDIFALGSSIGLAILTLAYIVLQLRFELLFAFAVWLLLFVLVTKLRNTRVSSGYSFSAFLLTAVALKIVFFRDSNDLNFAIALATLSLVVFLFRWRVTHHGRTFVQRFIERIKAEINRQKERIRER